MVAVEKAGGSSRTPRSSSGMHGQAGPRVQHAQGFANHIECVAGGAPPVAGIERIAGRRAHDGAAWARSEPAPEQTGAARMSFCGDDNYDFAFTAGESSCGDF